MERTPVSSSNVASVGYDDASSTLEVEFHSGAVYQYFDVPRSIFEMINQADSPGAVVNEQLRGVYRYARV